MLKAQLDANDRADYVREIIHLAPDRVFLQEISPTNAIRLPSLSIIWGQSLTGIAVLG